MHVKEERGGEENTKEEMIKEKEISSFAKIYLGNPKKESKVMLRF